MKTRTLSVLGAAGLVAATFASPAMAGTAPGSGFALSGHDATQRNATTGACVECHTPHQAKTTNLLWNHTLSTSSFNWGVTNATTAGTTYATFNGATYAGMSAKCLSCHDGTVATAQGSWFMATLQPTGTSFIGTGRLTSPWSVIGGFNNGSNGVNNRPTAGEGTNGGGHMEGTHPLAMPYPYTRAVSRYNGVSNGPGIILTEWVSTPETYGIRLYTDVNGDGAQISAGPTAGKTGMECGSCHDVHNGSAVQDEYLVRGKLIGNGGPIPGTPSDNYICAKCHAK